jgi:hypothetical protein
MSNFVDTIMEGLELLARVDFCNQGLLGRISTVEALFVLIPQQKEVCPTMVKKGYYPEMSSDDIRDTIVVFQMSMVVSGPVLRSESSEERKPTDLILIMNQCVERRVKSRSRQGSSAKPHSDASSEDLEKCKTSLCRLAKSLETGQKGSAPS